MCSEHSFIVVDELST